MRKTLYLIVTFALISSCKSKQTTSHQNNVTNYQDGLDDLGKNSKFNNRLKDIYRAYYVRNIYEEIDNYLYTASLINPTYSSEFTINGKPVKYVIYPVNKIKLLKYKVSLIQGISFYDKKLNYLTGLCIKRLSKLLNEIKPHKKMFFSVNTNFGILYADPMFRKITLEKYLSRYYDIKTFTNLSEQEYWAIINKKNYIKDVRYETYKKLIEKNQFERAIDLLRKTISETRDFQEQSIYKIQLADQLISKDYWSESKSHFLESKTIYETILKANKYSLYLFESWVKWRSVSQAMIGFSAKDTVQIQKFEKMRLANIKTIYSYLQANPKDPMATNYFLTLSSHNAYFNYEKQNKEEFYEYFRIVNL